MSCYPILIRSELENRGVIFTSEIGGLLLIALRGLDLLHLYAFPPFSVGRLQANKTSASSGASLGSALQCNTSTNCNQRRG